MHASTMSDLEDFAQNHRGWLFRGQRGPGWRLETSLERTSRRCQLRTVEYERAVYREFMRHAHAYLVGRVPDRFDTFEWLALMQHYGAPTRLLDFSESFWIAAFFAFEEAEEDCAVWALDPSSLAKKKEGLDYNLILRENIEEGRHVDDFLYGNSPFFTNPRLSAQKGTFVHSLNVRRPFHELLVENEKRFKQVTISAKLFPAIRCKLNEFGCNARCLFPGIDGYARYFRNHTF